MKRVFGTVEAVFDSVYLVTGAVLGILLLSRSDGETTRILAGLMALILAGGDSFHLIPRIAVILTGREEPRRRALGRGKQITSITMTVYYLLLWLLGLRLFSLPLLSIPSAAIFLLGALRIGLCFAPQNRWTDRCPPVQWGIYRNLPFLLMGLGTALLFFLHRAEAGGLSLLWLAVLISFACYLPVVLFSNRNPKIGMLMLPKTCAYLIMLFQFLSL